MGRRSSVVSLVRTFGVGGVVVGFAAEVGVGIAGSVGAESSGVGDDDNAFLPWRVASILTSFRRNPAALSG